MTRAHRRLSSGDKSLARRLPIALARDKAPQRRGTMKGTKVLALLTLALITISARPAEAHHRARGTIEQLLDLDVRPFAIAHRGFGDNRGEDPSRPIENSVAAVRRGFQAGASIVEVDVQLTRDGEVVVFHDDFLDDFTCLNSLSFGELRHRMPFIPSLAAV